MVTVRGEVEPEALGVTLAHEHLYIRLWEIAGRYDFAGMLEDDDILAEELAAFVAQGGQSLVELTVPAIGRQPRRLVEMSERTGLHVVMGCGWYREPYYPPEDRIDRRTVEDLAAELVAEIRDGVGDTGIRPGIIGEIGTDKSWVSAQEERCHRAAARAARRTGLSVATHSVGSDVAMAQLDLFEDEGLDLGRVVVGHADSYPSLDYYRQVLARGATLSFDNLGAFPPPYTERILDHVATLVGEGHGRRIVVSHDVCKRDMLSFLGGRGYAFVLGEALPGLRRRGLDDAAVEDLVVTNPRGLLTVATAS